jgi:hypothetical protein
MRERGPHARGDAGGGMGRQGGELGQGNWSQPKCLVSLFFCIISYLNSRFEFLPYFKNLIFDFKFICGFHTEIKCTIKSASMK